MLSYRLPLKLGSKSKIVVLKPFAVLYKIFSEHPPSNKLINGIEAFAYRGKRQI